MATVTPASPPSTPAAFELKSAALTLLSLALKTPTLDALAQELDRQVAGAPGLFDHEPVALDLSALREADAAIDFDALITLLRARSLMPIAVRGGSAAQMGAARALGLAEAPEALAAPPRARPAPAAPPAPTPATPVVVPTLYVDRPLRSGQQVYARGGDLVMLAVVNDGAEVLADGNIHVYAPLRGRAVAGARGDTAARIFSTCMEPQLVSIAGTYLTVEARLPSNVHGKPAQVRLQDDRLVVEALPS